MGAVKSHGDVDLGIFEDFKRQSRRRFDEFRNSGKSFAREKLDVSTLFIPNAAPSSANQTAPHGDVCLGINVVNYRQTVFREILPNMDGSLHPKPQTYGLAMMCVQTGPFVSDLEHVHLQSQVCRFSLECKHPAGGKIVMNNQTQMFGPRNIEHFLGIIKFIEVEEYMSFFSVRFTQHEFSSKHYDQSGTCVGTDASYLVQYDQMHSGALDAEASSSSSSQAQV